MDDSIVHIYFFVLNFSCRSGFLGLGVGIRRSFGLGLSFGLLLIFGGFLLLATSEHTKDHHNGQHECKELCKFGLHVFSSLFFYILRLAPENISFG